MRTALMIAITIGMLISPAAAQSKGEGKARVETQEQCEARQQKIRDPASAFRQVMRRGFAIDKGRSGRVHQF